MGLTDAETLTDEQTKIVDFWVSFLEGRKHDGDNGGDDAGTVISMRLMAAVNKGPKKVHPEDQIAKFREAVGEFLYWGYRIETDYQPQWKLRDACEMAGIDPENLLTFPYKTRTFINDDGKAIINDPAGTRELETT